jgi:2,3-bisphosphoglycerate-dependent phosphoglycerate mutase
MHTLVLLRHGESTWNRENRFTGWRDVPLSPQGLVEAAEAGRRLRERGLGFDLAYTSLLKRAIKTLWVVLEELDLMWIPVQRRWQLNERHYGALTGLDKAETAARHGEEQVLVWRRSYDVAPPPFAVGDPANPANDRRYAALTERERPLTESLRETVGRAVPCFEKEIAPEIRRGRRVLVAAHGNSLRALVKHLDGISESEILGLNIPTGIPLVYELDESLKPLRHSYLASDEEVSAAMHKVAAQGKARA